MGAVQKTRIQVIRVFFVSKYIYLFLYSAGKSKLKEVFSDLPAAGDSKRR